MVKGHLYCGLHGDSLVSFFFTGQFFLTTNQTAGVLVGDQQFHHLDLLLDSQD